MRDADAAVIDVLKRLEDRLNERAAVGRLNALLAGSDPSLVLPSPACAVAEISTHVSWGPAPSEGFRSLEPHGDAVSEVVFTPVYPELGAHPWRIAGTEWLTERERGGSLAEHGLARRRGIRAVLAREQGSVARNGRLVVMGESRESLWTLASARAVHDGTRLPWGRLRLPIRVAEAGYPYSAGLAHRLDAVTSNLFCLGLPPAALSGLAWVVEWIFEEPLVIARQEPPPRLRANVIPVWNSARVSWPPLAAAGQALAETSGKHVLTLNADSLGARWSPWSVDEVAAAGAPRIRFTPRVLLGEGGQNPSGEVFHLAFFPAGAAHDVASARPRLAVVLSSEARRRLDLERRTLEMGFWATSGSAGNDVPDGAELRLIDLRGLPVSTRITARLVGTSWGGNDGLPLRALAELPEEVPAAMLPASTRRTVGDVERVVNAVFGDRLVIVDPRDLLRRDCGSTLRPLTLRVRFRRPDLSFAERRQVRRACQGFVDEYLLGQPVGGLRVVEAEGDDVDATE